MGSTAAADRPPRPPRTLRRADALALTLLAALAALPYLDVRGYGFVFDDLGYLTGNPAVRRGLTQDSLRWAFTTFTMGNWHPVTWISHLADISLFGLAPGPAHVVNVALHAVNALLLYLLAVRAGLPRAAGFAAAALFGVHPLHVESVAWISERKDLLAGAFFLASLLAYVRYARRPAAGAALAVAGFFALGLLSKPMVVTLPFVLLLLDWWPLGRMAGPGAPQGSVPVRRLAALAAEKAPLLCLSAAAGAVALRAQREVWALGSVQDFPVGERLANALVSYVKYLGATLWPRGLGPFYLFPARVAPAWELAAAGTLLAALTAAALAVRRRAPQALVGWLWFLGCLVPVIGLLQVGSQARADRYMYLPLAGLLLAVVGAAGTLARSRPALRAAAACLAAAAVVALAAAAHRQSGFWRDEIALFGRSVELDPEDWLSQGDLGEALYKARRYAEALPHLVRAVHLYPKYYEANVSLGLTFSALGRKEEAVAALSRAARDNPGAPQAWVNLAVVFVEMGRKADALAIQRRLQGPFPAEAARVLAFIDTLP